MTSSTENVTSTSLHRTKTTAKYDGADSSEEWINIAAPLVITAIVVVFVVLVAVFIWRRKQRVRHGKRFRSYYGNKNIWNGRYNRTDGCNQSPAVAISNSEGTLDSQNGFGCSRARYQEITLNDADMASDTGYCTITVPPDELRTDSYDRVSLQPTANVAAWTNYSHITVNVSDPDTRETGPHTGHAIDTELSNTLWTDTYNKLETNPKINIARAYGQNNSAYDHVIQGGENVNTENEDEFSDLTAMPQEDDVRGLKHGHAYMTEKNNDDNEGIQSNVAGAYLPTNDNRISHRYVILEPDGFYFVREEMN